MLASPDKSFAPKRRIVLIDDHAAIAGLLAAMVKDWMGADYDVVGQAHSGRAGLELCRRERPDFVVLDLMMPDQTGADLLRQLFQFLPDVRVLIFTGTLEAAPLADVLKLGAHGVVSKTAAPQTLRDALLTVAGGGRYVDPVLFPYVGLSPGPTLSAREREVLQHIAIGNSTKEIASQLGLSVKTVDNHRTSLMNKLDLHDAVRLTRYAIRNGLVPPP